MSASREPKSATARVCSFLFAFILIALSGLPALAGPFDDAVTKFANDSFSDTQEAVGEIAVSGNPRALDIIGALQDERLSSREAESRLALREKDWRARKKPLDAAAAAVILQDYLDARA